MNPRTALIATGLMLAFGISNISQAQTTSTPSKSEEEKETRPKVQNKLTPHSHLQEKTGIPQSQPKEKSASEKAKAKKLHSHQRDAK